MRNMLHLFMFMNNKISWLFETKIWCSSTSLLHKLRALIRQQFNNDNSTGGAKTLSQLLVSLIPGVKTAAAGCNEDSQHSVDVEVDLVRSTVALESDTKPSKTPSALAEWWWAWVTNWTITCCGATVGCFAMTTTQLVCCTRLCLSQIRDFVDVITN